MAYYERRLLQQTPNLGHRTSLNYVSNFKGTSGTPNGNFKWPFGLIGANTRNNAFESLIHLTQLLILSVGKAKRPFLV